MKLFIIFVIKKYLILKIKQQQHPPPPFPLCVCERDLQNNCILSYFSSQINSENLVFTIFSHSFPLSTFPFAIKQI